MPYVKPEIRTSLDALLFPSNAGELNYVITRTVLSYLGASPNYQRYNDVIGALESAKLELYRRAVAPYEDTKIIENGDVY